MMKLYVQTCGQSGEKDYVSNTEWLEGLCKEYIMVRPSVLFKHCQGVLMPGG